MILRYKMIDSSINSDCPNQSAQYVKCAFSLISKTYSTCELYTDDALFYSISSNSAGDSLFQEVIQTVNF
jgi:hypothetical protein